MRNLVREAHLSAQNLIYPMFVQEGVSLETPIDAMPGQSRLSIDLLVARCTTAFELGVSGVALFPVIPDAQKDVRATVSIDPDNVLLKATRALKEALPDFLVITDVALDPYSTDGHCGLVVDGRVDNDQSLPILAAMAVAQAEAGADMVAPSDMMDGRIGAVRVALDEAGFTDSAIMSYATKYASGFYGPFREALDSAPKGGDKKTYQMDPANGREALREVRLDVGEGADWVMVKPGLPYLDIVWRVRQATELPVAIYQVSGEYSMLKAAAANGWLDYDECLLESLTGMRRAGADIIFTYGAIDAARLLAAATFGR